MCTWETSFESFGQYIHNNLVNINYRYHYDGAVLKLPLGTPGAAEGDDFLLINHEDDIKIQLDAVVNACDWDTVSAVSVQMRKVASCHILSNC